MTRRAVLLVLMVLSLTPLVNAQNKAAKVNPAIDMQGYLRVAAEAARHRESRRLSEEQFIMMSREPGTVILDARSKEKFDELHIKGATNLSFPDIAVESLNRLLPDKNARILIYCNNNFSGPAAEGPFPTKKATASLNISTYIALYNYGYRNVYELAPLLDLKSTKLEFESLDPAAPATAAPVETTKQPAPAPVVVSP